MSTTNNNNDNMSDGENAPEEVVPGVAGDILQGEFADEDEDKDEIADLDFEIIGLHRNSKGQSCCCHETCGLHVSKNDILRIVKTVVTASYV